MAVREFTKAYQTSDGRVFVDKNEAENHEEIHTLLGVIRQVKADARHDTFGATRLCDYDHRLAEELIKAGLRLVRN